MRIVVSGAAGFIGSHMCDRLLAEGHTVVGLDNFLTGSRRNLAHLAGEPRFGLIEQDITQPFSVGGPINCVVNLASPASPKDYLGHPIETLDAGSIGTRRMLDLALGKDARIFNTYGPRMKLDDGRVAPAFLGQALRGEPLTVFGDGSQTRGFCYVSDMVDGLCRLMLSEERFPVNLGNPREMTILEFSEHIRRITGSQSPIVFQALPEDDPKQRCPDISKARAVLGWEPRVPMEEGLGPTVEYFRGLQAGAAQHRWAGR